VGFAAGSVGQRPGPTRDQRQQPQLRVPSPTTAVPNASLLALAGQNTGCETAGHELAQPHEPESTLSTEIGANLVL
jgi:hypothetical protein